MQRLQRPRGFLAAGHAEVEAGLHAEEQRVGVVLAGVAALAAVLLRHRRHHPAAQRPARGKRHPFRDRHGLVVPGRRAVVTVGERVGAAVGVQAGPGGGRRRAVVAQQPGEEAVQPGALLRRERRILGQHRRPHHGTFSSPNCLQAAEVEPLGELLEGFVRPVAFGQVNAKQPFDQRRNLFCRNVAAEFPADRRVRA